jgi:hypothetical protein
MDAFERRRGRERRFPRHAKKPGAFENEVWPKPFTAGQDSVAKRFRQARGRPIGLLFRQAFREKSFDGCCGIAKLGKKL